MTDDAIVYGNPQALRLVDRDDVAGVTHDAREIRIERRGWRPAITCDPSDTDDPAAVVTALTEHSGQVSS